MGKPFFQRNRVGLPMAAAPPGLLPKCDACGLYKKCKSPKMRPSGEGKRSILIVAEAPGADEDDRGIQFVGVTGRELERTLDKFDIDMRKDCWLTNALICRPPNNEIESEKQIGYCRPNLIKTVKELKPEIILLLGAPAVKSLLGWLLGSDPGGVLQWAGFQIPSQKLNAWIFPTFHPSFVMQSRDEPVARVIWERHLKAFAKLKGRPWEDVPDYASQVIIEKDPDKAAKYLGVLEKKGQPVAFDYETNCLKPDHPNAWIRTCAFSNGEYTLAYPMVGAAIEATKSILTSSIPKYAHNLKFEDRWSLAKLGVKVRGWREAGFDSMNAAHVLDSRAGVCGLDFAAFTLLGQQPWDTQVRPYLQSKSKGGYEFNRVKDCPLDDLLLYNGLDALIGYKIATLQMKELKWGTSTQRS